MDQLSINPGLCALARRRQQPAKHQAQPEMFARHPGGGERSP
jgi:hypothetical protein